MSDETRTVIWQRNEPISVPVSAQERRIAIRYLDWDRCKIRLSKTRQEVPRFHLIFSFLFGIAASSAFSLSAFYANPAANLPTWIYPLFMLIFVFSLCNGAIFVALDRRMRRDQKSDVDDILEDMVSIEKTFT
jgi:hypothetical protein